MALEDKYKPFWESEDEKKSEDKLKNAAEGMVIQSKINQEIMDNVEKESKPSHGSFEEYLINERMNKKIKVEQINDSDDEDEEDGDRVFDQENLNEDTNEDYSGTYSKPFPFFETFMAFIGIAVIALFGYLIFTNIQSQVFSQANTTSWENYTGNQTSPLITKLNITDQRYNDTVLINAVNTTANIQVGGVVNNQFLFLNPFITILMVGIALMIVTRHRSIFPFIITSMMAMFAIIIFDASWLVMLIPGTLLLIKSTRSVMR